MGFKTQISSQNEGPIQVKAGVQSAYVEQYVIVGFAF